MCSALKMGLFLHAVGSAPPTESAAERVRLSSQKQGSLSQDCKLTSHPAKLANCPTRDELAY